MAFTVIDHTEVGSGGVASWNKSSISQDYDHLYLAISARTDGNRYYGSLDMRFNGEAGTYSNTAFYTASTSSIGYTRESARTQLVNAFFPGADTTANTFGVSTFWIPHYSNDFGYKPVICKTGSPTSGVAATDWIFGYMAGLWNNDDPITQITVAEGSGDDYVQYSTFTLYGVSAS